MPIPHDIPYEVPTMVMIEHDGNEQLYELEKEAHTALRVVAKELQRVMELEHFYQQALPFALLTQLESWDTQASIAAATGYLKEKGYTVTKS